LAELGVVFDGGFLYPDANPIRPDLASRPKWNKDEMTLYSFRLYVTGETAASREATENLQALCETRLQGRYELEIIDVLEQPESAEEERIIATPTVVRLSPPPRERVIGDLSDVRLAARALGFPDSRDSPSKGART
jgi:circadian clock protein KaiB